MDLQKLTTPQNLRKAKRKLLDYLSKEKRKTFTNGLHNLRQSRIIQNIFSKGV